MTRHLFGFVILLTGLAFVQSCTIQKRKYLPGWHVTTKKINRGNSNRNTATNENPKRKEKQEIFSEIDLTQEPAAECPTAELTPEFESSTKALTDSSRISNIQKNRTVEKSLKFIRQRNTEQKHKSVPQEFDEPDDDDEKEEENKPWFGKLFGGLLGFLLALIALPPLFIILFFIFEEDAEDLDGFSISRANSPFVRSFKKCFNDLFLTGYLLLTILFIIFMGIVICGVLYSELGVLGILLGIIIFLLLYWLLSSLGRGISKIVFPER